MGNPKDPKYPNPEAQTPAKPNALHLGPGPALP